MLRRWVLPLAGIAIIGSIACSGDEGIVDVARRDARVDSGRVDGVGDGSATADGGDDTGASGDTMSDFDADETSVGESGTDDATAIDVITFDIPRDMGAPDACVPGAVSCTTADRTRTCLDDGGSTESDCPAGQLCVDGMGCRACEPGATRCAADGLTIETCAADGTRWTAGMRCDSAAGMVCEGYRCVNACARAASQRSYLGCEYWPTTLSNSAMGPFGGNFTFGVTVANPQSYPVSVTITGGALAVPNTFTVMPSSTNTVSLPWVTTLSQLRTNGATTSVLARNGAYRLVSNAPVAAYQFNPLEYQSGGGFSYSNDASLLLPTHVLTGNYMAITHPTWRFGSGGNYGGQLVIVGTNATPTTVMVRLRGSIRAGSGVAASGAGTTTMYMLNRGDALELIGGGSASAGSRCDQDDLSGSVVSADHPVAVFTGHDCTYMPCASAACDHLEEQLFPNETWGRRYVVSGLRERGAAEPSVIRVISQVAANTLTFDGIATPAGCGVLNAGQFCEFQTTPDFAVTGTGAFLVAQFMVSQDVIAGASGGDPAMVLEVPSQQFRTNYTINVPGSYAQNFLTIVYPTGMLPSIDGRAVTAGTAVGASGFSVTRFATTAGNHRLAGPAPFGIKVTGVGQYTSYMYPGGLDLNQITSGS